MGTLNNTPKGSSILSTTMPCIGQRGISFLFLLVGTVSGMDPGSDSTLGIQLSNLGSQLIKIQEQVEALQQENIEDKEQIVHLEQVIEELERRVSLLESACTSTD